MNHSLRGQVLFGLRMEESLKIQPHLADLGEHLYIVKSKGNRARLIPVRTEEQYEWIKEAKVFAKSKQGSLIPVDTKYITYRRRFEKACERAGIKLRHGLRHRYVQNRYLELTGWPCPVKGGPEKLVLTADQRKKDKAVRLLLSEELGHSRISVLKRYLS
jgi:hypothetical protein